MACWPVLAGTGLCFAVPFGGVVCGQSSYACLELTWVARVSLGFGGSRARASASLLWTVSVHWFGLFGSGCFFGCVILAWHTHGLVGFCPIDVGFCAVFMLIWSGA